MSSVDPATPGRLRSSTGADGFGEWPDTPIQTPTGSHRPTSPGRLQPPSPERRLPEWTPPPSPWEWALGQRSEAEIRTPAGSSRAVVGSSALELV